MADEMDTCEYIWNHELAMRRLLSLLRNGQAYCTDAECLDVQPDAASAEASGNQFLMTFVVLVLAVLLYALRPSSFRRNGANIRPNNDKPPPPSTHNDDSGSDPPAID